MAEYVNVKDLPLSVRDALRAVSYGKADIEVRTETTVTMSDAGQSGRRAFVTLINLTSGQTRTVHGSWGGQNMFNTANAVDNDTNAYPIPDNGAILRGSTGGGGTWATLHIPASMRAGILPAAPESITKEERDALYCHKSIKAGAYRRDEMTRRRVTPETVDALVTRGYLKRNAAGSVTITTAGKNAVGDYRGYGE